MCRVVKIVFVLIVFVFAVGCASQQIVPAEDRNFSKVQDFDYSSVEIHNKSRQWVALGFRSANDVIQLDNESDGILIVKGNTEITYTLMPMTTSFTLMIESRDQRARFSVSDAVVISGSSRIPLTNQLQIEKFLESAEGLFENWRMFLESGTEDW